MADRAHEVNECRFRTAHRHASVGAAACVFFSAHLALAHHDARPPPTSPQAAVPGTRLAAIGSVGRLSGGGARAPLPPSDWQVVTVQGELGIVPSLRRRRSRTPFASVMVHLPVARVRRWMSATDGDATPGLADPAASRPVTNTGLGDAEFGLRLHLYSAASGQCGLGAWFEVPTGRASRGLGGGHGGISPFAQCTGRLGNWQFSGVATLVLSVAPNPAKHDPAVPDGLSSSPGARPWIRPAVERGRVHGAPYAPHSRQEFLGQFGFGRRMGRFTPLLGWDIVVPSVRWERGPYDGRVQIAYELSRTTSLWAAATGPLGGERRSDWSASCGVAWAGLAK